MAWVDGNRVGLGLGGHTVLRRYVRFGGDVCLRGVPFMYYSNGSCTYVLRLRLAVVILLCHAMPCHAILLELSCSLYSHVLVVI